MTLVPAKIVVPYLLGSFVISYVFWDLTRHRKIFGGTTPRTLSDEWKQATDALFDNGWPRVAGPPVVMNPQSRQNYRIVKTEEE
ncbi:hypothetical protein KP509_14G022100 [Ceratopteris richardii]|uniref:Uncharacterized protein n=1 Tax=Ceratopteris richardii TaxID=49495 RepID=A0A8T2T8G6_CERRI|nr:hypothetical protein KP509_14G022100 [Ceratopteris richardii]